MSEEATTVAVQQLTKTDFYKPEPKPPMRDGRAWGLALPALMGVVGLCAFAVIAFAASEIVWLPQVFRTNTVLLGAIALAVGGEIGTLFTNIEIFRKVANGTTTFWDWTALVTSLLATILAFVVAVGALLGADVVWSDFVKTWMRIGLIVVAALDQYAGQMELGLYVGTYDRRYREWETEYFEWRKWAAQVTGWAAGSSRVQRVVLEEVPPDQVAGKVLPPTEKKPRRKKKVAKKATDRGFKVAPRGERDHYAREVEDNGWMAVCPECDWTRGGYDTKANAIQAIIGHSKGCPGRISVEGKVGPGEWKDGRF